MDKPEQGANREFEGGIFSGGTMQEAQSTEALRMDNYFDYARGMQGKWQDMHGGQQPERNPRNHGREMSDYFGTNWPVCPGSRNRKLWNLTALHSEVR